MNDKCPHHEAVDVRLSHLEAQMKTITRMFWTIIVGLIINLAVNLNGGNHFNSGAGASDRDANKGVEMLEEVRNGLRMALN